MPRKSARSLFTFRHLAFLVGVSIVYISGRIQHDSSNAGADESPRMSLDSAAPGHLGIKLSEGSGNDSWKLVDWQNSISAEEESKFNCKMTTFQSSQSGKEAQMCVHAFSDHVSNSIKNNKHWGDCDILPKLWNAGKKNDDDSPYYLEIGANIGSCVMEMLMGTDARIIAFEPHPMNLYNLKKTVSQLDKSFQDRLVLFPVGLGNKSETSTIYSANNNMGNSVIGKVIKDSSEQGFDEKLQFTIHVERLDSILEAKNIKIKLAKMDAQGFECNLLEGMGEGLAEKIDVVKFEYADHWLHGQGCMDLLPRMNKFGFDIYGEEKKMGISVKPLEAGAVPGKDVVVDLFAYKK